MRIGWFTDVPPSACPKPRPVFPNVICVVRGELIARFVDNDGIVDHHCLSKPSFHSVNSPNVSVIRE